MKRYFFISLGLFVFLLGLILFAAPAGAQGQNYLQNPSFEGAYYTYVPGSAWDQADCPYGVCMTVQVPQGWGPWWARTRATDVNPEYKAAAWPYMNRVHSGGQAAQYFSFYRTHTAGFYQQATVPANAILKFSIWAQAWINADDTLYSDRDAPANLRIGIHPSGGTDPFSPEVIWSELAHPYDEYQLLEVRARAQGNVVTVFTYSSPEYPMKHNDIYWDDASLVVVDSLGATPAPATSPAAAPGAAPEAEPGQYIVRSGDTLASIARRAGVSIYDILALNYIEDPRIIRVGQVLTLPPGATIAQAAGGAGTPVAGATPVPAVAAQPWLADSSPTGIFASPWTNLRLRSGPDPSFAEVVTAQNGSRLPVLGKTPAGDYLKVMYREQVGWVNAWYTQLSGGTMDQLPVVEP